MREFGRRAEAAVAHVEQARHLVGGAADEIGAHRAGLRLVQCLHDMRANRARVRHHAIALFAVRTRDFHQHPVKSRPSIGIIIRREVGAAEEHLAVRRQKGGEGPAALPAQRLHGPLVARVDIRTLVAIDLDADEIAVQDLGDLWILVRLAVHDMAPVAPDGADVEEDGLLLLARARERGVAPGQPVDGLVGGGFQVCRGFRRQEVSHALTV